MELKDLIRNLIGQRINEIHTAIPARIEEYDPGRLEATITILANETLEGKDLVLKPIVRVPVSVFKAGPFVIRPPYKKGDVVIVVFSERALDKILVDGQPKDPQFSRKFSRDDAIVIGGLITENTSDLPSEYGDALYIANIESNSKIIIQANGDIFIESGKVYLGGADASHGIPFGDSLKTWLDGHTHIVTVDPGTHTGNAQAPLSPSPAPSTIVKVK